MTKFTKSLLARPPHNNITKTTLMALQSGWYGPRRRRSWRFKEGGRVHEKIYGFIFSYFFIMFMYFDVLHLSIVFMTSMYLIMDVSIDGRRTLFHFFLNQKLKEILIRYIRIILKASKDRLISKIWRVWLKDWACHAHLNFEVQMAANQSILKLMTSPFGF